MDSVIKKIYEDGKFNYFVVDNDEEYAIVEKTVLIDSQNKQLVSLTDKHHNVLDKKYGLKEESVKLQFSELIFEYLIQGPLENGESIETKFKINRNDPEEIMRNQLDDHSDVEDPAVDWDPPEMNKTEYDDTGKPKEFKNQEIMPIGINYCYNLVEVNLYKNSISYLPRSLLIPNLMKLKRNRFLTFPLLEQLPKLFSVEIDDNICRKINKESLAYLYELNIIFGDSKRFNPYGVTDAVQDIASIGSNNNELLEEARFGIACADVSICWLPDDSRFVSPRSTNFDNGG